MRLGGWLRRRYLRRRHCLRAASTEARRKIKNTQGEREWGGGGGGMSSYVARYTQHEYESISIKYSAAWYT